MPGRFYSCALQALAVLALLCFGSWNSAEAQVVAFGASNVSGWNVAATQAFPAQLQAMLRAKGYSTRVINAGIFGNTTTDMLNRLDHDIPQGTKIVILDASGGLFNDRDKGISQQQGNADMAAIEARLKARGITVFTMSGAELAPQYHQHDGIHLTPEGHKLVAEELLPEVMQALGPPTQSPTTAQSGGPSQDVIAACKADAQRLCPDVLSDADKRRACMHDHRSELSKDCLNAIVKSRQGGG